jgi:hypothetical protein
MSHTLTFALDNIKTGKIYTLRTKSYNCKNFSQYSDLLSVAAVSPPMKANIPQVDYSRSSINSLFV